MFFGGDALGSMLEAHLEKGQSIRNDIQLIEYLTRVAASEVSEDYSDVFFTQELPERLLKSLPQGVPKETTMNIAKALTDIVREPLLLKEMLYFYILPQFCEGILLYKTV